MHAIPIGKSLCLLGDAMAMSFDSLTYIIAYFVEDYKIQNRGKLLPASTTWLIEIFIPTHSVLLLLFVALYIFVSAVNVLRQPQAVANDTVNVVYIYGFSITNLLLDTVCILLLMSKKETFEEKIVGTPSY